MGAILTRKCEVNDGDGDPSAKVFRCTQRDNRWNKARFRACVALNRAVFDVGQQPMLVTGWLYWMPSEDGGVGAGV